MKNLKEILQGVDVNNIIGETDKNIKGVYLDSREVSKDSIFFAVKGTLTDGHLFINKAIENGATVIFCEKIPEENLTKGITYIRIENMQKNMAIAVSNFYDNPSKAIKLIGVTGTNGKTTIATLLYQLMMKMDKKSGLLSTVENKIGEETLKSTHTTPDVIKLNELLKKMKEAGCEYAFMEVSSHAIDQGRTEDLDFDIAIFTNITHDHLDYHGNFKNYINTKKKFFDNLKPESFALTNIDDTNGMVMVQNSKANIRTYSVRQMADYKAKILQNSILGLHLKINGDEIFFKLRGEFNAYNLLAVYGTMHLLGFDKMETLVQMSNLNPVTGRFDIIPNKENTIFAIIDYAHTPDALKNILSTLVNIKKKEAKIITVFGAGGDRDKSKRPKMGKIAARLSDTVIVTSDNPRTEDPGDIINDIVAGIDHKAKEKVLEIEDRRQAIKTAIKLADKNDLIVIAGKGHEDYQEINGKKFPFSDKEVVKNIWYKDINR